MDEAPEDTPQAIPSFSPEVEPPQSASQGGVPAVQFGLAIGPRPSVLETFAAKMTPEQIGEALAGNRQAEDKAHDRVMEVIRTARQLAIAGLVAVVLVCLIFVGFGQATVFKDIIVFLVGALVGATGGYGAAHIKPSKQPPPLP